MVATKCFGLCVLFAAFAVVQQQVSAAQISVSGGMATAAVPSSGFRHPGCLVTLGDIARIQRGLVAKDPMMTNAFERLRISPFAQTGVTTRPTEAIVRGGRGENYMNAAYGAAAAFQNALLWRIGGDTNHAETAVRILMQWARTAKTVTGDTNYALASGIYGYEFANAGELLRGYPGWSAADFEAFRRWMRDVWYPAAIGFLRQRNGTWENTGNKPGAGWGANGDRPGHYWSNWGLCNVLCVMSIGILCDDVFLYNQGVSFYKHDQTGTFAEPRPDGPVRFRGCQEFLGDLVVVTSPDAAEKDAFGRIGQMAESGRDQGHATMAVALAADICQTAFNQGDDLFAWMDNRLAAGIEFEAAYNNAARDDLPWRPVIYATCRTAWHAAWLQKGPSTLGRGITRSGWGTVIGYYEGLRGVTLPFARRAFEQMGVDGGPEGHASGPFDHLGFSVLLHYRPKAAASAVFTPLRAVIIRDGKRLEQGELGGEKNDYRPGTANSTLVPRGTVLTLRAELPPGVPDTGVWVWNDGTNGRERRIVVDRSLVCRVAYTNRQGVKSVQMFSIAAGSEN